jgi:hypothetical protein
MNAIDTRCRVYDPDAIETMGWAFDKAFEGLSQESKRQSNMRQELALCIMRLFDEGENRPLRLCRLALAIITIITDSNRKRVSNGVITCSSTFSVPFPLGTAGWHVAA